MKQHKSNFALHSIISVAPSLSPLPSPFDSELYGEVCIFQIMGGWRWSIGVCDGGDQPCADWQSTTKAPLTPCGGNGGGFC